MTPAKEPTHETRYPEVFGLTVGQALEYLRIARANLPNAIKEWPWAQPMFSKHGTPKDLVRDNISFFVGTYEAQFNIWDHNNYEVTEEQRQRDHDAYLKDMSDWPPMKRRIVESYSGAIIMQIIIGAEKSLFIHSMDIVISTIEELTNDLYFAKFILSDVIFKLRIYTHELEDVLESGKKRGKYRKPEDRPRPDLPSNHYENLTARPIGIRATQAMRDTVDEAASREGLSRNEWVSAAMEEKLLRDHPDLLMQRNVKLPRSEPS